MTWTISTSGTSTGSTTETTIASSSANATYVFSLDTSNMVIGDLVTIRCYDMVDGTNFRIAWQGTFQHAQIAAAKETPPLAITAQVKFTLIQGSTIARTFPWVLRSI
jgi:hypothetical protein